MSTADKNEQESDGLYQNRNTVYYDIDKKDEIANTVNFSKDISGANLNEKLTEEWISLTDTLTADQLEFLLKGARALAEKNVFLRKLRESNRSPSLYADSPRKMSLPDFIQTEWVDNGWNPPEIERSIIAEYDGKLLKAVADFEHKKATTLPDHLRFKKSRNRVSKAETSRARQSTPKPGIE